MAPTTRKAVIVEEETAGAKVDDTVVSELLTDPATVDEVDEVEEDDDDFLDEVNEAWDLDSLPPDEPLWEDGPTPALVKMWKQQYGDEDVYLTAIRGNKWVVWRTLNRFEYRNLVKNVEQMVASGTVSQGEANLNNEEAVSEMCILWPKMTRAQIVQENAGLASLISQQVMEASSFVALDIRLL